MAWPWVRYFFDETDLRDSELLLALAIADFANDEGVCWPGANRLSSRIRRSPRRVKELMAILRQKGFLEVAGRKSLSRGYVPILQLKRAADSASFNTPKDANGWGQRMRTDAERMRTAGSVYKDLNDLHETSFRTAATKQNYPNNLTVRKPDTVGKFSGEETRREVCSTCDGRQMVFPKANSIEGATPCPDCTGAVKEPNL